jgi:hypothetical protein
MYNSFCFCNGSRISCSYFANDNDALKYQVQEYDVIFFSGGRIGFQIELGIADLGKAIDFQLTDIVKED